MDVLASNFPFLFLLSITTTIVEEKLQNLRATFIDKITQVLKVIHGYASYYTTTKPPSAGGCCDKSYCIFTKLLCLDIHTTHMTFYANGIT